MNSDRTEEISAMTMELKNQRAKLVVSKSLLKFSKLAFFGISADELSVPSGLKAEDTTNRMGKIAKNNATMPTICRQPTCRNQPPLALPSLTTCGGLASPCGVYSSSA